MSKTGHRIGGRFPAVLCPFKTGKKRLLQLALSVPKTQGMVKVNEKVYSAPFTARSDCHVWGSLVTFFVARVIPSDPAAKWAGPRATPEQIAKARLELGLDKPLVVQFGKYLMDLIHGNLGYSLRTRRPVALELMESLPATIELVLLSTFAAVFVGIPLGVISAKQKDHLVDHLSRLFSIGAVSLPTFWIGLILQLVFARTLHWFPMGGS